MRSETQTSGKDDGVAYHEVESGEAVEPEDVPHDSRLAGLQRLLALDRTLTSREMADLLAYLRRGDDEECYDPKMVDDILEENAPGKARAAALVP